MNEVNILMVGRTVASVKYDREKLLTFEYIVARMWRLYKTGIGLTTGFTGLHTVTVYTLYSSQL
jgi:hypothetical protein